MIKQAILWMGLDVKKLYLAQNAIKADHLWCAQMKKALMQGKL